MKPAQIRQALRDAGQNGIGKEFTTGDRHSVPPRPIAASPKKPSPFPELPACPLCKSPASWEHTAASYGYYSATHGITCTNEECGISTPMFQDEGYQPGRGMYSILPEVIEKLVTIWSRRP